MTTLELLQAARALISDPARWAQGAPAHGKRGQHVFPTWPGAKAWSAFGALWRLEEKAGADATEAAYQALCAETGIKEWRGLDTFNDTHTHAGVLALFDRTIARLESEARS